MIGIMKFLNESENIIEMVRDSPTQYANCSCGTENDKLEESHLNSFKCFTIHKCL